MIYSGNYQDLKTASTPNRHIYIRQEKKLKDNPRRTKHYISISDATSNNLKHVSVNIPQNAITVITGIAGAGKSSLVNVLCQQHSEVVIVDQKRLKGTRRSNVATYIGIMDDIRNLFAQTNHIKASIFSTNSERACPECNGMGTISTDLAFMDAIEVTCDCLQWKRV